MTSPETTALATQDISQAVEAYRGTTDDLTRERVLNQGVVRLNEVGIATSDSLGAVISLIRQEVDPKHPVYMPNAVSDLSGDNLLGIANAVFYEEGPRTQTLMQVADRIRNIGARVTNRDTALSPEAHPANPASEEMQYVFQEMAERLIDDKIDDEARRGLVLAIDHNMTPQLMEHILRHQPDLVEALIRTKGEFQNPVLKSILDKRDQIAFKAPENTSENSSEAS